jgi:2-oxoglutarate ferredoxin oxidoreductase subunit beta
MTRGPAMTTGPATTGSPYLEAGTLPLTFCPGCGHGKIAGYLDQALKVLGYAPEQVVLVTDIGCIGMMDKSFGVNTFHGLHGRSVTYAEGIKLANPALKVIVLMGDGGMGIGGGHLLAAARRNIGITVIVANNFNYGMTGGQQSVTTPAGIATSSTPWGNVEMPLDIVETLRPARPSFLARTSVMSGDAAEVVTEAVTTEGFALVDIWDVCVAYFARRHPLNRETMARLMEELEMPPGIVRRDDRPEFSRAYRDQTSPAETAKPTPRAGLDPITRSSLGEPRRVIVCGSAGLKIRSAATVLGAGAILSGLQATQKDDYPVTVRTGYSVAEVIVSPDPILYTGVDVPDIGLILSQDGLTYLKRKLPGFPPTTRLYVEEKLGEVTTGASVTYLPLQETAKSVHHLAVAAVGMGAILGTEHLYPPEAFAEASRRLQDEKAATTNVEGLKLGLKLVGA